MVHTFLEGAIHRTVNRCRKTPQSWALAPPLQARTAARWRRCCCISHRNRTSPASSPSPAWAPVATPMPSMRAARMLSDTRHLDDLKDANILPDKPTVRAVLRTQLRDPGGNLLKGYQTDTPMAGRPLTRLIAAALSDDSHPPRHHAALPRLPRRARDRCGTLATATGFRCRDRGGCIGSLPRSAPHRDRLLVDCGAAADGADWHRRLQPRRAPPGSPHRENDSNWGSTRCRRNSAKAAWARSTWHAMPCCGVPPPSS